MVIPAGIPSELLVLLWDKDITSLLGDDIALLRGDTETSFLKDVPTFKTKKNH